MPHQLGNPFYRRTLTAVLTGILWAAAFPRISIAATAWLVPGLMCVIVRRWPRGLAFRWGWVAGLAHCLISLYWLLFIPFPLGAVCGWLALSAFLALFPAVWLGWMQRNFSAGGDEANSRAPIEDGPWVKRLLWALGGAAAWVCLEMLRGRVLTGFPWNFLGASQIDFPPLIQISSLTGVYGLSFLLCWFSLAMAGTLLRMAKARANPRGWMADMALPLLAVVATVLFGFHRIARWQPGERTLRIALIQPSIPQTLIWDSQENTNRFRKLIDLSELALTTKPDLLIWPEAAVPNVLRYDPDLTYPAVTNLVQQHRVWLILGADDVEPAGMRQGATDRFFNSSFLVAPSGDFKADYRKLRLVMFGEYIPLVQWFPFLRFLAPIGEGFTPGKRPVPFPLPSFQTQASVLICFEDTFAHGVRDYVQDDTDFLINLTNDGWFGESAAQWQHALNAAFRSVEYGLPLVRCANNGITCWIDPLGRLHDVGYGDDSDVYRPGFKVVEVPLPDKTPTRTPTFYRRHGDWFGWVCVAVTLLGCLRKKP